MTTTPPATTPATRSRRHGEEGAAIVEMALAFLLFSTMLWGVISYGVIFSVSHTLDQAAAEGARAAIATRTVEAAKLAATDTVTDQLSGLGTIAANAVIDEPTVAPCPGEIGVDCITVTVRYPWGTTPIVPELIPNSTPDELTATSTIQLTQ